MKWGTIIKFVGIAFAILIGCLGALIGMYRFFLWMLEAV